MKRITENSQRSVLAKIFSLVLSWPDPSGTAAIEPGDPLQQSGTAETGPEVSMVNEIHIGEEEKTAEINFGGEPS